MILKLCCQLISKIFGGGYYLEAREAGISIEKGDVLEVSGAIHPRGRQGWMGYRGDRSVKDRRDEV
jgi:hypothetical protein